ncbi:YidC/Oxa1 family membrane protein insertase [Sedimentibacter sp. zth1]|uniref:YidC/Oxa1 family membrane protein insertase n=1 Tax=Sedimentibacter sp. zth1 TaxID=2816908 RepID=UPI001A920603|nr:YidC/Oxa1 family membrane protein insertase [Sedimentibacter sp. zth1]QSX05184.1 YidC/Oxa1 family membrane protein insertase [Sedimentibacter sp. zth1]
MNLDFIAKPMGWIMRLFYNLVSSLNIEVLSAYAIAIILSTIAIKLLILPLTLKQTKSMKIMQDLSPRLKDIQEKYGKDPQTLQRKQMELYKEVKYNPLSGCLPMLIQLPLIFAFFWVIRDPGFAFSDMGSYFNLSQLASQINLNLADINASLKLADESTIKSLQGLFNYAQLNNIDYSSIKDAIMLSGDKFWIWTTDMNRAFFWIKDLSFASNSILPGTTIVNGLNIGVKLPFFGQALPILAVISAYTTYLTTKMMSGTQMSAMNEQAKTTNNMMTKMMPVIIFITAINFSSGLALYWVVTNIFQLVQQYVVLHSSKKVREE